jgi:hypothetical protein
LTGIKKTCDNRFSTDRLDFKECKKIADLIAFWQVYFGKYGPGRTVQKWENKYY